MFQYFKIESLKKTPNIKKITIIYSNSVFSWEEITVKKPLEGLTASRQSY